MTGIPGTAYRHAGEPFPKDDCPGECWCLTCLRERQLRAEIGRLRGLIDEAEWGGWGDDSTQGYEECPWCRQKERDGGHAADCPAFPQKD
jgi:hypothetical protein